MRTDNKPLRLVSIAIAAAFFGSAGLAAAQTQAPAAASKQPKPKTAAPKAASAAEGDVVARIGGQDITADQIRATLAMLPPEHQVALARDPALLSQTVRMVLANRLVLAEAAAKNWGEQPAVVEQLKRIRESAITESYLQSVSTPPASYPSDAEIQEAYDANKTAFVVPRQFRLAQIFVASQKDADAATAEKAKAKLADIQSKLKQKADFAGLAKELSDQKENAQNGGEIGWVAENQIRPEIKDQVMGLDANAVSEPIRLDDGWHLIKLLETKPASTRALDEQVRQLLIERLRAQRAEALRREYLARLLEKNPPAINEIALSKVFDAAPTNSTK